MTSSEDRGSKGAHEGSATNPPGQSGKPAAGEGLSTRASGIGARAPSSGVPPSVVARRTSRAGRPDVYYAIWARAYVEWLRLGSKTPVKDLATAPPVAIAGYSSGEKSWSEGMIRDVLAGSEAPRPPHPLAFRSRRRRAHPEVPKPPSILSRTRSARTRLAEGSSGSVLCFPARGSRGGTGRRSRHVAFLNVDRIPLSIGEPSWLRTCSSPIQRGCGTMRM
jgi:hypothetical protein